MASLTALRAGLATRLATISGLRASATIPDNPSPPIAVVMPGRITYDTAFGRGSDEYTFDVMLIVGRVADRASQNNLDAYCASSGSASIKAAIEADRYHLNWKTERDRPGDFVLRVTWSTGEILEKEVVVR